MKSKKISFTWNLRTHLSDSPLSPRGVNNNTTAQHATSFCARVRMRVSACLQDTCLHVAIPGLRYHIAVSTWLYGLLYGYTVMTNKYTFL